MKIKDSNCLNNSTLTSCVVEFKFRWPTVPVLGHLPDDNAGHPDGKRRPQPGAAHLQTPGQSAGSPSDGQHLPSHLHDHHGSTGCPLRDHVTGMVSSVQLLQQRQHPRIQRAKLWSWGFAFIPGIFHSIQLRSEKKICLTWRTPAYFCRLVSSTSSWL